MNYMKDQAEVLFSYWPDKAKTFIVAGVGDGNELDTVKDRYPNVTCIGFEPCPEGIEFNAGSSHHIERVALWNEVTELDMYVVGVNGRSSRVCGPIPPCNDTPEEVKEIVRVKATTLDMYNETHQLKDVVLWLDVEYAECYVLEGASKFLNEVLMVNVEVTDWSSRKKQIDGLLNPYRLELRTVWNTGKVRDRVDAIYCRSRV